MHLKDIHIEIYPWATMEVEIFLSFECKIEEMSNLLFCTRDQARALIYGWIQTELLLKYCSMNNELHNKKSESFQHHLLGGIFCFDGNLKTREALLQNQS